MANLHETVRRFMPWSHSKISLAEKCPRAFKFRYVERGGSKEGTEARVGTAAHAYLEHRLDGTSTDAASEKASSAVKALTTEEIETLGERNRQSETYIRRIADFRGRAAIRHEGFEVKLAVRADGGGCGYEDPDALIRGSVDHLIEQQDDRALIIDHKSGRVQRIDYYGAQLDSYKLMVSSNRKHLRVLQAGVHHLQDTSLIWQPSTPAANAQRVLLPWLLDRIERAARGLEGYPVKPTALCWWCDYHERCPEGLAVPKPASILKRERDAERKKNGPRLKKDGTPYATRQKRAAATEPHAEVESIGDMFPDEIIL